MAGRRALLLTTGGHLRLAGAPGNLLLAVDVFEHVDAPTTRTYYVAAEDRTVRVPTEPRTYYVPAEESPQ